MPSSSSDSSSEEGLPSRRRRIYHSPVNTSASDAEAASGSNFKSDSNSANEGKSADDCATMPNGVGTKKNRKKKKTDKKKGGKDEKFDPKVLEIQFVDQKFDPKRHEYITKTVDRGTILQPKGEESSKKPVLVIRRHFNSSGPPETITVWADIKSDALMTVLRELLKDVKSVSLHGKQPSIQLKILFHFRQKFDHYISDAKDPDADGVRHLKTLNDFLEEWYASTNEELKSLLDEGEITYDLLWALFKPNDRIFNREPDSSEPRAMVYDHGDAHKRKHEKYFELSCRSVHFDGSFFGEVVSYIRIPLYRGARKIISLEAYPLSWHPRAAETEEEFVKRGRKAVSLIGIHHREFKGYAFYKTPQGPVRLHVKGRIMIDAESFKRFNANYQVPEIEFGDEQFYARRYGERGPMGGRTAKKRKELEPNEVTDSEAALVHPCVTGYSLSKRLWAEFPVDSISDIAWDNVPFNSLVLAPQKKELLRALVEQVAADGDRENCEQGSKSFDDVIQDKGAGLVILLHGSPGVGKTLTAEAISEYQHTPLYRVTAGDLDPDGFKLEAKLSEILDLATRWNAIILLDEADVFVESRVDQGLLHNRLISIFLRQLEYFQGIMILTTNRVKVIDEAVKSRIHLGLKFDDLNLKARAKVWTTFIERASAAAEIGSTITEKQILDLAQKPSNGRLIKNTVRIAYALARSNDEALAVRHVEMAMDANEDFDLEHRALGLPRDTANSYL